MCALMRLLDIDDGYDRPRWMNALHSALAPLGIPLILVLRKLRPLRA
jgi:hypothetical protein